MKSKGNIFYIIMIIFIILIAFLLINVLVNKGKGSLIKISYNELEKKIDNKDTFILIDSRSTCSHCASYKPKLEKIANEYNLDIYYIDHDLETKQTEEKFLEEFDLDGSTPITMFIKKGKQTNLFDRIEGETSEKNAINKFKKMGYIK